MNLPQLHLRKLTRALATLGLALAASWALPQFATGNQGGASFEEGNQIGTLPSKTGSGSGLPGSVTPGFPSTSFEPALVLTMTPESLAEVLHGTYGEGFAIIHGVPGSPELRRFEFYGNISLVLGRAALATHELELAVQLGDHFGAALQSLEWNGTVSRKVLPAGVDRAIPFERMLATGMLDDASVHLSLRGLRDQRQALSIHANPYDVTLEFHN